MIDQKHIDALSPQLKAILKEELDSGNAVAETCCGGFTECSEDHVFVFLKYPFRSAVVRDMEGIIYREINDPHYGKAEYEDEKNHRTLACGF